MSTCELCLYNTSCVQNYGNWMDKLRYSSISSCGFISDQEVVLTVICQVR